MWAHLGKYDETGPLGHLSSCSYLVHPPSPSYPFLLDEVYFRLTTQIIPRTTHDSAHWIPETLPIWNTHIPPPGFEINRLPAFLSLKSHFIMFSFCNADIWQHASNIRALKLDIFMSDSSSLLCDNLNFMPHSLCSQIQFENRQVRADLFQTLRK